MAATPALGLSWMLMLLVGGAGALPVGGAPLPLDPALSAIAPDDCLWYAASAGMGPADPASANQTEQLLAEPQVQRFFAEIESQVMSVVRRTGSSQRESRILVTEVPKVVKALLTRPMALYVEDVQKTAAGKVAAEAAFVLNAGDQRAALAASLSELAKLGAEKGLKLSVESAAGVDWQRVELPPDAPLVRFGWKDNYFIIAIGDNAPAQVVDRMGGSAPAWLTKLRAEHPIEREMSIGYLNVAGILERVRPLVEAENPQAWPVVERLGLTSITALHAVAGYDAVGCTSIAHIVTNAERPGLLAFLPYQPLKGDDLAVIPKDALIASAVRLNPTELLDQGVALAAQFNPQAKEDFETHLWEVESHLDVNVRQDIVGALGDAWVAYLPSGDVTLSWLNSAAAVQVKDAPRLRTAVAKLLDIVKAEMVRKEARLSITESLVDGQTVYSLQFLGEPIPFSPSLCIADKWLVVGLMPQAVHAALERKADDSLAALPAVEAALSSDESPAALYYQDTPQLVRSAYPFVQMGVQMLSGTLRGQGITIDPTALPAVDTIVKHLQPTIGVWAHADDGFHATRHGSFPGGSSVGSAPVIAGLLLPAVAQARAAARQAQDLNNLRQLSLAFLNYESAYRGFVTDVYSEDGKPLLSWRVRLLPYFETGGNDIYNQINLDEPWDSEHNRQFHDQMPAVYNSVSAPGQSGRTRIVALKGKETLFPGNEKLGFAGVRDGTSNTILFVQAAPEAAVEWMKPADIDFDPKQPFAGVAQPSGMFLAAFCDGSVHRLSLALGNDGMKGLATRAGGEVVDYEAFNAEPAPDLYPVDAPVDTTLQEVGSQ